MSDEEPADPLVMSRLRLARIVYDLERLAPSDLETLLTTLTAAVWPTRRALAS